MIDRGDQDYDPLTTLRMEVDALKVSNHALEVEIGRVRAERDDLQGKLAEAWALLRTRDQVNVVEQAIGGTDA